MPTPVDRNALALSMITTLPSWGTWASSMREVDTPFGKIGYRQASIMWILRHHQVAADNQSTTGLAAHLGIQNSVVTRSCERLEQLGLVERTTDEHDRRRSHVELTSAGLEASKYIEELYLRSIVGAMADLDDDAVAELSEAVATLQRIGANLFGHPPGS